MRSISSLIGANMTDQKGLNILTKIAYDCAGNVWQIDRTPEFYRASICPIHGAIECNFMFGTGATLYDAVIDLRKKLYNKNLLIPEVRHGQ